MIRTNLLTKRVNVVLVGAGGTGSHVLRRLATMDMAMRELGHPEGIHVTVFDKDTVSKTNVGRQNFWPSDVGQGKAEVLVNRINMMMGTNWNARSEFITPNSRLDGVDIVIGCVDNRAGRKAIVEALRRGYQKTYYLDIGNQSHDGQVVFGEVWPERFEKEGGVRLPHAADLFPEIIDDSLDDKDDTPSCSMAEALEKQSLFVNDTMAGAACNILWELFRYGQISHHGMFVNIKSGRTSPLAVDPETWKRFGFDPTTAKPKRTRKKKAA